MVTGYFVNIIFGILCFFAGIFYIFKHRGKSDNVCKIFGIVISIFYVFDILFSILPFKGLNLRNVTPLSNMSPLLFSLTFISLFLPTSIRKHLYSFFSIFNIVMLIAALFTNISGILTHSLYFGFALFDTLGHIAFSLFSIYLLASNSVVLKKIDLLKILAICAGILLLVITLNALFDTSFFGLCFNEYWGIYGFKIGGNPIISIFIYSIGLFAVVIGGYLVGKHINKIANKQN